MTEQPLRIGIVCYPTFGGSGAVATELGIHLARRGHTVHFISYSRPFRLAHGHHKNIYYHAIDTIQYPLFLGPMYGISASVRIYDIIREARLEILHVHYALPHAVCAYLANEMLPPEDRIPVVTTLHGTDITLIGKTPAFRPAVRLGLDKSTSLTCVSKWLSDQTCRHFDICERLNIIYNFVDTDDCKPGEAAVPRSDFAAPNESLLLHISNFRAVKRIPDVIRAFAAICQTTPARLILVGNGPELEPGMRLAGELGVAERVKAVGEQPDVRPYISISDLFLFPSDGESFGLAAAEALACEVPVVGALAGGLPEVVIEGESGYLLPVGDVEGMASASVRLLRDPDLRKKMGAAGRRRMKENFSPDLIIPQYEMIYASTLRRTKPTADAAVT